MKRTSRKISIWIISYYLTGLMIASLLIPLSDLSKFISTYVAHALYAYATVYLFGPFFWPLMLYFTFSFKLGLIGVFASFLTTIASLFMIAGVSLFIENNYFIS